MTDFDSRDLPAFREWSQGFQPAPDTNAYLAEHLSITAATFFAEVLLPELVLARGCVILASRYEPSNFEHWWSREDGDQVSIERALNHLHLWDLFEPDSEMEERAIEDLADRIAHCWRMHAEHTFPDRSFSVEVTDEYGPTVVMSSGPRKPR